MRALAIIGPGISEMIDLAQAEFGRNTFAMWGFAGLT